MRIDKVEIDGFGKLNHVSLSFASDFNVILGDNESGKSTLCAFLLAMFYEIPNEGTRMKLKDSIRQKYRPWKGEAFGGRVYFTDDDDKQYVLEKSIGTTKRSDKVKLLYADTWDVAGDGENAGERFFGFGREGFLKTLYMKSLSLTEGGAEEILAKLSNMETSGDEDVSYTGIKNTLEKAQNALRSKTGKGGSLSKLEAERDALENEKLQFLHTRERLSKEEEALGALKDEIQQKEAKRIELEKIYALAVAHEAYVSFAREAEGRRVLNERLLQEQEQLRVLTEKMEAAGNPENIGAAEENLSLAKELETKLFIAKSKQEEYEKNRQLLLEKEAIDAAKKKKLRLLIPVLVLLVFLAPGAFLITSVKTAGIALCFIGVIVAVSSYIILGRSPKAKTPEVETESPGEEYDRLKRELDGLLKTAEVESVSELYARVLSGKNTEQTKAELAQQIETKKQQILQIEESISGMKAPEEKSFTEEEMRYDGPTRDELRRRIELLQQELNTANERFRELSVALAKETAEERSLADIESDISAVHEEILAQEMQYAAYVKAGEWLSKAHDEIRSNFAPRLNRETAEIFSCLTNGKYSEVRVGEGFMVNFQNESGEIVEADYLSSGTYDLLYVALRLSTLLSLSESGAPMLIADDTFLQLDDDRIRRAARFLLDSGKFGQVLYFTCHRETANLFQDERIHLVDLNQEGVLEKRG